MDQEQNRKGNFSKKIGFAVLLLSGALTVLAGILLLSGNFFTPAFLERLCAIRRIPFSQEMYYFYKDKYTWFLNTMIFTGVLLCASGLFFHFRERIPALLRERLSELSERYGKAGFFLISAAFSYGIFFRVDFYCRHTLWLDNLMLTMNLIRKSYAELLGKLDYLQSAPPGFLLWSKTAGELFGYNSLTLSALPFLAGIASLFLFFRLLREFLDSKYIAFPFLFFALNPALIYYSGDSKQYSLDVFFTVLIFYGMIQLMKGGTARTRWLCMAGGAVAPAFSHASLLVLPAAGATVFFYLLFNKKYAVLRQILPLEIVWGISVLFFGIAAKCTMPPAMQTDPVHIRAYAPFPWTEGALGWYEKLVREGSVYPLGLNTRFTPWLSVLALALLIAGIIYLLKMEKWKAFLLLSPMVFLFGLSLLKMYPVHTGETPHAARLSLFLVPPLLIFAGCGLKCLSRLSPRTVFPAGLFFLLLSLALYGSTFFVFWDSAPLVKILLNNRRSGDYICCNGVGVYALTVHSGGRLRPENINGILGSGQDAEKVVRAPGRYWVFLIQVPDFPLQTVISRFRREKDFREYSSPFTTLLYFEQVSGNDTGMPVPPK